MLNYGTQRNKEKAARQDIFKLIVFIKFSMAKQTYEIVLNWLTVLNEHCSPHLFIHLFALNIS